MIDNVTISSDRNLIKGSRRAYTMSLVVFNSILMTLYTMLDLEELVRLTWSLRVKDRLNVHYKTRSFYLMTSLLIHLKGRMTFVWIIILMRQFSHR